MFNSVTISRRRFLEAAAASGVATSMLHFNPAFAQEEGNFVYADIGEPANLGPWIGGIGSFSNRAIYETLLETRMTLNDDETVTIDFVPVLAESWERVDDLTWRFSIRQGVTFTNGEPLNAEAVKATWDVLSDPEVAAENNSIAILRAFQSCEIVDEFTVDITTYAPDNEAIGYFLRLGLVILPAQKLADEGVASFNEDPVGTGPYQLQSWNRGQQLVLERNTGYWNAEFPNNYQTITYIFRPEAAVRAQTIASGEADFAFNIGAEQAFTLPNSVVGGGFQSTSIRINNSIEPTSNLDLRLALNHAIDRDAISDVIFQGTATPIAFFAFQPVELEPFTYDPELATQLINEGGWAGIELELVYGEGRVPEEDQLAELYKAYFEAVGLVINLRKVEPGQYDEIGGQEFTSQPPLYMETTSSGNYGEIAGGLQDKYGSEGSGTFADETFDARFATLATLEGEERVAELQSIAEDLHAIAPRVWVAGIQQVHGISERVNPTLPLNSWILVQDLVG